MIDLLVLGAGGFGREVAEYARALSARCRLKGFLDDDEALQGLRIGDVPVLGTTHTYRFAPTDWFVVAVGDPVARRAMSDRASSRGGHPFSLVHPTACISSTAVVHDGALLGPFAFVGPAAVLEPHACLNAYASVGYDARVGESAVLSPYAALLGAARIGAGVFMGSCSTVLADLSVGEGAKIAAGAVVASDVPPSALAAGNPATARIVFGAWSR